MPYKILGKEVGDIGFGLMGLTIKQDSITYDEAIEVMKAALEAGCNYWNGGEFYGTPENNSLTLLNKYFEKYPEDADRVAVNIKGAVQRNGFQVRMTGSREGVGGSIENCLRMLGPRGRIDEFELARKDPDVPYEESVLAIDEFVKAGKIGSVACSEIGAATLRKAAALTKITSVELEVSLWSTEPLTNGLAATCAELGIPILAYSPLGQGFLTGKIKSPTDLPAADFRNMLPRWRPENFDANLKLVAEVEKLAAKKGCTPAQIAINWLIAQSQKPGMPKIIPIPGASSVERVRENSTIIKLTTEDLAEIDQIVTSFTPAGKRYTEHLEKFIDKDV